MNFSRNEVLAHLSEGNVLTADQFKSLFPKKVSFLITQTTTGDPAGTTVHNDTGIAPVFARSNTGVYTLTMTGAFTADKVILPTNTSRITFVRTSANVITISTFSADLATAADSVLSATPLNIEIWD